MDEPFLNFQKFYDREVAQEMAEQLESLGIQVMLEDTNTYFDISFAHDQMQRIVWLKIRGADFIRAGDALDTYYSGQLDKIKTDYYLFQFTDEELLDIVKAPDEWGYLDYPLAIRILKQRGHEITLSEINQFKKQRLNILAKPEAESRSWVWLGYLMAILAWPFGLIAGSVMMTMKKTLPSGARVYAYSAKDRIHGKWMLWIGGGGLLIWILRIWG